MEKSVRQWKYFWKKIKTVESVNKSNSQEISLSNSQGAVEENEEDDTITQRGGSSQAKEDQDSDEM
jgi:hypothetical protein